MAQLKLELPDPASPTTNQHIDYGEASRLLGVSVATLRNWVKAEHIRPEANRTQRPVFKYGDVLRLKGELAEGRLDRLRTRANKRGSTSTFIPAEYLSSRGNYEQVQRVVRLLARYQVSVQTKMLLLALNLLIKAGLVVTDVDKAADAAALVFTSKHVQRVWSEWTADCPGITLPQFTDVLTASLPAERDVLGVIYQSLLEEGSKAQGGSYYTPAEVVDVILREHEAFMTPETTVLDPCCGTGQFLLSLSARVANPRNLWGYDIDRTAVHIARINMLLAYPKDDFFPNIYCEDTLEANVDSRLDVVTTNPPWGYHFTDDEVSRLIRLYPSITSGEAFSYFIAKGLGLLREKRPRPRPGATDELARPALLPRPRPPLREMGRMKD